MKVSTVVASAAFLIGCLIGQTAAHATDIRILSSTGLEEVFKDLAPAFERTAGHKLLMEFDVSVGVKRKAEAGARFDVAFATPQVIDDLARQAKVEPGTDIARVGLGVAIRAGSARPDISTTAAFRETLLRAGSIMYSKDGQGGLYMAALMERLGIADQVRAKTRLNTVAGSVAESVARGEAELGFQLISEILAVQGVQLLGPLPPELQTFVVLRAGIAVGSPNPEASKALVQFLGTPAAADAFRKHGMESLAR